MLSSLKRWSLVNCQSILGQSVFVLCWVVVVGVVGGGCGVCCWFGPHLLRRTPKCCSLFSPLPPHFVLFLSLSLWGSSRWILVVFLKAGTLKCTRLGSPNVQIWVHPTLQTPPKFHEKTPRERQKERKWWREREKKRNVGRSGGRGVGRRGVQRVESGGAPKSWTHPRKIWTHTAPTHHTTQQQRGIPHKVVLGKGGPSQGGQWPKEQDMNNKLSRRAAPMAKIQGSRMVRNKIEKIPKIKKMEKSLSSLLPDQKNKQHNQKWKKIFLKKNRKMFRFLLLFLLLLCF